MNSLLKKYDDKEQTGTNFNPQIIQKEEQSINMDKILKILYFVGQIDPGWIEHLNVLFSEKKVHYLPNSDSLDLSEFRIFFETQHLRYASPAFISKTTIVVFDNNILKWENILYEWFNTNKKLEPSNEIKNYVRGLFDNYFPRIYEFILINKTNGFEFSELYVMKNIIALFDVTN